METNNQSSLTLQATEFVQQLMVEEIQAKFLFHNYGYTADVVDSVIELTKESDFSKEEKENIILSAIFHNVGFTKNHQKPTENSIEIAKEFLENLGTKETRISAILKLIDSTKQGYNPTNEFEKTLHDARFAYLGQKGFQRKSELLRLEIKEISDKTYSNQEWINHLINFQSSKKFLTVGANELYGVRKNKNIAKLRKNLIKAKKVTIRKKTGKDFGRGVDTIYRITLRNHIDLSSIADGKANMMISINTIVLSILITAFSAGFSMIDLNLEANFRMIIVPVALLMFTCLFAILFAVLSAIPKVGGTEFTEEDVTNHNVNLLFFGNFLKIEKPRFVRYLRELKDDQSILYDDLSRDLYNLGLVLNKKYRLLNISYRVFMGGLVISFLSFLIVSIFFR